jgi:tellurite resistance protein TerC
VDISFILVVIQILFLDCVLSIDNAAVLGAMVSVLPTNQPIPWPNALKFLSGPGDKILGPQRRGALLIGLLAAYGGRLLMLALAVFIIQNPVLKLLGAIYLIKLAFDNLGETAEGKEEADSEHNAGGMQGKGFWYVSMALVMADMAFSLDNVVAVIALSQDMLVVSLGVLFAILLMRVAANIFCWLIEREPILEAAAYMIVFNIGFELMLSEFNIAEIDSATKFVISIATLALFIFYAHVKPLHVLKPIFLWVSRGMGLVSEMLDWVLVPVVQAFKLIWFVVRPLTRLLPHQPVQPDAPSAPAEFRKTEGAGSTDEP